jgi:hypothetical protein
MKNNKIRIDKVYKDNESFNEFEIIKEMKANSVVKERLELYRDFVINLICYAHTTYFGKDFVKTDEDIKGHYTWAFNRVLSEFEQEGIHFTMTNELNEYFFEYFTQQFYNFEVVPPIKQYMSFWDDIFSVYPKKDKKVMKVLVDLYQIFDTSLENKKSLIEA